jgi:hypothetical protein
MATSNVRPDIDEAAKRLRTVIGSRHDIRRLPALLDEGEAVHLLTTAITARSHGLLAATDRRLLFVAHGLIADRTVSVRYEATDLAEWHAGPLSGTLTLSTAEGTTRFGHLLKDDGRAVADALTDRVGRVVCTELPEDASLSAREDVATRLAVLARQLETGKLTEAQYQDRRARILRSL